MRYAVEYNVAESIKDYIEALLSDDAHDSALVCAFTDPNIDDDSDRIGVMVPSCAGSAETRGNYTAKVEVGIKTATGQPTLEDDKLRHFSRVSKVRGGFMIDSVRELIQEGASEHIGINFIQVAQDCTTQVFQGWFYSQVNIDLEVFIK